MSTVSSVAVAVGTTTATSVGSVRHILVTMRQIVMDLNYRRCPEDQAKVMSTDVDVGSGRIVTLGLAEIVTALAMKGALYTTTLAIKNGVPNDFVGRAAIGLRHQVGADDHVLCPVMDILCECFALLNGGKVVVDKEGLVDIFPARPCPTWLRGYFDQRESE